MTATKKLTDDQLMIIAALGVFIQVFANFLDGVPETMLMLTSSAVCTYAVIQMYRAGWMGFKFSNLRRKR